MSGEELATEIYARLLTTEVCYRNLLENPERMKEIFETYRDIARSASEVFYKNNSVNSGMVDYNSDYQF